jgi:flavodoxin
MPVVEEGPETLLILYGSQQGTAECLAKRIHTEALTRGYASQAAIGNRFRDLHLEAQQTVIVVTSTTGDGMPPDNIMRFYGSPPSLPLIIPAPLWHLFTLEFQTMTVGG